jgi:predicted DNA-binding transcriptional regulator AlpA
MSASTPSNNPHHPNRGRFMRPRDVHSILGGAVSEWWIRRNVAPTKKVRLGHSTTGWWESDVRAWLDGLDRAS